MEVGDRAPDLAFEVEPGRTRRLADWGAGPWALIFLRHLA